jgi:prepilin-type processing-associated H-X9-DG protein
VTVNGQTELVGRSNYLANLGSNAWWRNSDATTGGVFYFNSAVRLTDITDGTSNTAMYAEVKRGDNDGVYDRLSVTSVPFGTWDGGLPGSDNAPLGACDAGGSFFDYTGLQYYRGLMWVAFYTHTVPPNYTGHDCVRGTGLDRGHQAARSYHTNGVNVLFGDGSVHFVNNSISMTAWRALGTRGGGEVLDGSGF